MFVHDVTDEILSCDSNYIVYAGIWPKFGNGGISMRDVVVTYILHGFDQKNHFFFEKGSLGSCSIIWAGTRYGLDV